MTRTPFVLAPLALLLLAPHAGAAVRARTAHGEYTTDGNVAGLMVGTVTVNHQHYGSVSFGTLRRDRSFDVSLTDRTGLPVLAQVSQDVDGDGTSDSDVVVCGRTTAPIPVKGKGAFVTVYMLTGPCGGGASVPTTGTVTVTFRP